MRRPLFAACLSVALTACTSSPPAPGPNVLAGQVIGWPAAKGTLKVEAYTAQGSKGVLAAGPLGLDGRFRLALPAGDAVTPYLRMTAGAFAGCPDIVVEPADLETIEWPAVTVYDESGLETLGIVTLGDSDPTVVGAVVVFRLYARQEGSVQGDCDGTTHDLTVRSGWNIITATRTAPTKVAVRSEAPSGGAEWRFVSEGSAAAAVRTLARVGGPRP